MPEYSWDKKPLIKVRKKAVGHILLLGFTLILMGYVCYIGLKNIFRYNAFMLEYKNVTAQVEEEARRNLIIKRQLLKMRDADYWEVQAKQQLGYINEGETVYNLYPAVKP
jgi:cell division protein FtsB